LNELPQGGHLSSAHRAPRSAVREARLQDSPAARTSRGQ
jgi:hypothetical protein